MDCIGHLLCSTSDSLGLICISSNCFMNPFPWRLHPVSPRWNLTACCLSYFLLCSILRLTGANVPLTYVQTRLAPLWAVFNQWEWWINAPPSLPLSRWFSMHSIRLLTKTWSLKQLLIVVVKTITHPTMAFSSSMFHALHLTTALCNIFIY